jgi:hypothetical protein
MCLLCLVFAPDSLSARGVVVVPASALAPSAVASAQAIFPESELRALVGAGTLPWAPKLSVNDRRHLKNWFQGVIVKWKLGNFHKNLSGLARTPQNPQPGRSSSGSSENVFNTRKQDHRAANLRPFDEFPVVVFVSHRWETAEYPDRSGRQVLFVYCLLIAIYWHPEDATNLEKLIQAKGRISLVQFARECRRHKLPLGIFLDAVGIWYDYCCLPQGPRCCGDCTGRNWQACSAKDCDFSVFEEGKNNLPEIMSSCTMLCCPHSTYFHRGWCVMEHLVGFKYSVAQLAPMRKTRNETESCSVWLLQELLKDRIQLTNRADKYFVYEVTCRGENLCDEIFGLAVGRVLMKLLAALGAWFLLDGIRLENLFFPSGMQLVLTLMLVVANVDLLMTFAVSLPVFFPNMALLSACSRSVGTSVVEHRSMRSHVPLNFCLAHLGEVGVISTGSCPGSFYSKLLDGPRHPDGLGQRIIDQTP